MPTHQCHIIRAVPVVRYVVALLHWLLWRVVVIIAISVPVFHHPFRNLRPCHFRPSWVCNRILRTSSFPMVLPSQHRALPSHQHQHYANLLPIHFTS
ncbi:predicted coding region AF_0189 [Archaeoglobus fulgidus DSM 4304]|uniref:Uncharacterized protein AF_0189 n=1 Tax=Archaeoglobus fulgidus (strain ATCC 49558 / DSM 4304 / JCM 9628 / NBRC 100126 / VC-16) TaxID=224325 RepID=Y189_ARCFU|nr:RecName: Full=Uncharacterized protein AF_0189 [Archaeoglobus fulgidus DSM 4304]AAB91047.1 predicted coding region AF_0189 [Archaeoglobus fulgidus DSM 4304]